MNGDARLHGREAWRRALTVVALVAGGLAVVVVAAAFTVGSSAEGVVLNVETVASPIVPAAESETPAITPAEAPMPRLEDTSDTQSIGPSPTTTSTTLPPRVPPTALTIGDLDISQGVLPVGLNDDGTMEVPDVSDIGWYLHGATPGRPGATVLVAHVWWGDTAGPFHRLGALEPGDRIEVNGDTTHEYVVVGRAMYDKDSLPADLWRNSGPETLVLITCGGTLNKSTRRYEQNIVVYAVPIQDTIDPWQFG
ncbi:MAG: class F sortase [Actinomycetia bacterium]|nr:class F sortase [Actinomycetes bacterium]